MILDKIENIGLYSSINEKIAKVIEASKKYNAENFPKGQEFLDGENLYMNFANYDTNLREGALTEAHRKYIDVMVMISGSETVYVKPTKNLKNVTKEYTEEIEALLADTDDDTTAVRLEEGSFLVLFPQDAHAPGCIAGEKCSVKKIIGKVLI